jgi:hypothetical protein
MTVEGAPDPKEVFWLNVGLPNKARRTGRLLSLAATITLCFFWSIPVAFLSSLTEVNSLKETLPFLESLVERFPIVETWLALIAPLLLLSLNDVVLPFVLKWFATWEGHISSPALEASLFVKLCAFMVSIFMFGWTLALPILRCIASFARLSFAANKYCLSFAAHSNIFRVSGLWYNFRRAFKYPRRP